MKSTLLPLFALLATATPALSVPFTPRVLPAGFNAARLKSSDLGYLYFVQQPVAVDFSGSGRLQWYAGGTVISRFPDSGSITLPNITLPQWAPATVQPVTGIPIDIDQDGDQDILRVNSWGGMSGYYTMAVFVNQSGTFSPGWRLDFQSNPSWAAGNLQYALHAGDFDRDGDLDVAAMQTWEKTDTEVDPPLDRGSLSIRWNDGSGQFGAVTTLQSSKLDSKATLSAGDFDRDGDLDIVCGPQITYYEGDPHNYPALRVFENNGSGVFTGLTKAGNWPTTPVDFDRDGWLDLANAGRTASNLKTGSNAADFSLYNWSGAGALNNYPTAFADFDGDGLVDMITSLDKTVMLRRGNSLAQWSSPVTLTTVASQIFSIGAADSDADGDMDALLTQEDGTFVFLENRSHHWAPDAAGAGPDNGVVTLAGVTELHAADFNRDGFDDLLAVTPSQKKLWMYYGGTGGLPSTPVSKNTANAAAGGAAVADLDRDGTPDVAYTVPSTGEVRLARNNNTSFFSWTDSSLNTGNPGVSMITAGSLGTPNGRMDLFTASGSTGQLRWIYDNGSGWFSQTVRSSVTPLPDAILTGNTSPSTGDEPFQMSSDGGILRVRSYRLNPIWNDFQDLTFSVTGSPHTPVMAWGDMNGDNKNDLVLTTGAQSLGYWIPVTGGLTQSFIGSTTSAIRAFALADWDRDGRKDVLCATATGLSLFTRKNTGWIRDEIYSHNNGYTALAVLDLDRDGFMDVAAANSTTGEIQFIHSVPRVLHAEPVVPSAITLTAGQSESVMQINATHRGRPAGDSWLGDTDAAVTRAEIRFFRANSVNGSWIPGTSLTKTELAQILMSASLRTTGTLIGSAGPADIAADGSLMINYNTVLGNLVPISSGTTRELEIRLTLTPGAASSSVSKFFLYLHPLKGRVLDGEPVDSYIPVTTNLTPATLVTIEPYYTPLQTWRKNHFGNPDGTGNRANDADYDADGVPNLVEYVTGTRPEIAEPSLNNANGLYAIRPVSMQAPFKFRLAMHPDAMTDSQVKVSVQMSTGLTGWATLASRTGGGPWSGLLPDFAIPQNGVVVHPFTTSYTPVNTKRFFIRLKVEELP